MTIEEKINQILKENPPEEDYRKWRDIKFWGFWDTTNTTEESDQHIYQKVFDCIDQASIAECLTSPSEFVREYKKHLLKGKLNDKQTNESNK